MTRNLMTPTIHVNGTSKDELIKQLEMAGSSLNAAIAHLMDAAPHGRDYYPQGPGAYSQAATEHEDRIERLKSVYEELEQLMLAVADTPDWRSSNRGD